jgi:hypothetical protein
MTGSKSGRITLVTGAAFLLACGSSLGPSDTAFEPDRLSFRVEGSAYTYLNPPAYISSGIVDRTLRKRLSESRKRVLQHDQRHGSRHRHLRDPHLVQADRHVRLHGHGMGRGRRDGHRRRVSVDGPAAYGVMACSIWRQTVKTRCPITALWRTGPRRPALEAVGPGRPLL